MTELDVCLLPKLPETLNVTNRIKVKSPSLMGGGGIIFFLKADCVSLWTLLQRLLCYDLCEYL